jgi:predicted ABC-type transport system involved in lysophospholipase L1 biosynthesis ATPase subunit
VTEIASNPLNAEECLKFVGLEKRLNFFPAQLSGGDHTY